MNEPLLKIGLWNARGLVKNIEELRLFLSAHHANHPSGTAKGGSAVIVRKCIAHAQQAPISSLSMQAACASVQTNRGCIGIHSLYLPPNQPWSKTDFDDVLANLGDKFIAGGDFNAKHPWWGNTSTCTRGRRLQEAIASSSCQIIATGEPTFFSYTTSNRPTALDFFIINGIPTSNITVELKHDLSSDHLPIVATVHHVLQVKPKRQSILPRGLSIEEFQRTLDLSINLNTEINSPDDIEDTISTFMLNVKMAASTSTQAGQRSPIQHAPLPPNVRSLLRLERKVRKEYARTGDVRIHQIYVRLTNRVQKALAKVKQRSIDGLLERTYKPL